jgi:hypothetical protein
VLLQIDDWKFDIDVTATMEYSSAELAEHCDCAYCRNFYAAVDEAYPNLRPFLAQFGVDIAAPDELMPFDLDDQMCYFGVYSVCGKILCSGSTNNVVDGINLNISKDIELRFNTECPEPNFFIEVEELYLPWVLDEPMRDVVSTANSPSFLKKMWNKLLKKQPPNGLET